MVCIPRCSRSTYSGFGASGLSVLRDEACVGPYVASIARRATRGTTPRTGNTIFHGFTTEKMTTERSSRTIFTVLVGNEHIVDSAMK